MKSVVKIGPNVVMVMWGYPVLLIPVFISIKQEIERSCGLAQPFQQQLRWLLVSQLLTTLNCAMKLIVVILNTYTRVTNSLSAKADICNGLVY